MPEAAWFAASRPLGCVSDRTALVCVRLRLGIELVPVGRHEWSGGSAWRSQGPQGVWERSIIAVSCVSVFLLLLLSVAARTDAERQTTPPP